MPRIFTREAFYDLVWTKPMTELAKEFSISDVALHKICRKHNIPNPPLGWWAKMAAGVVAKEPEIIAAAREHARLLASSLDAERIVTQHKIVAATLRELRKARTPSYQGLVAVSGPGLIKTEVSPAALERVELVLDRLASSAETLEIKLIGDDSGAYFQCGDERIRFSITEGFRRSKHALTETEQALEANWKAKCEKAEQRRSWDAYLSLDRPRFPDWDYAPTGQLSLELQAPHLRWSMARRTFRDAKIQRLENMAGDILIGVHVLAGAVKEDRRRQDVLEQQRQEAAHRREQALRERFVGDRRNAALDKLLQDIGELDRLKRLMATLEAELGDSSLGRVSEFLSFARQRVLASELALQAGGLQSYFETERLFGDDDDHSFLPPLR
ncbi:hypothetical protein LTR94_023883 [Friedmanniomyces endolithicus]|nr:hypothetical protein LTR94_023883 [Friedmanniomyces endolithicus]